MGLNYMYRPEIRPKQPMLDHNLGRPPLKKVKTEPAIGNGQNGKTGTSTVQRMETASPNLKCWFLTIKLQYVLLMYPTLTC